MSSHNKNTLLIDLSQQFPFEIDDTKKNEICFSETLIISCSHCDGDNISDASSSEWSCSERPKEGIKVVKEKSKEIINIIHDQPEEESHSKSEEEENDFHFYFFPDCEKPVTNDSADSLVIQDGIPIINPLNKKTINCTCTVGKDGKCPCHIKIPCKCGAKTIDDCTCANAEDICICDEGKPQLKCICKPSNVCLCYQDKPRPICTCDQIGQPCICHPGKLPFPICPCEIKPLKDNGTNDNTKAEENIITTDIYLAPKSSKKDTKIEPCACQKPAPKPVCYCIKGKECLCEDKECMCGVQPTCYCESGSDSERVCKGDDSKTICNCPKTPTCTCVGETSSNCKCFTEPEVCSCGNPEDCKCFRTCECIQPCICDTEPKTDICTCSEQRLKIAGGICTCLPKNEESKKLKKVRAGKHGYRWCHSVDPKHTYFDYAYDRHDKIDHKEQEKEKLKILGLYEEPQLESNSKTQEIGALEFKKKFRKASLDCCSAVGGITISVDVLGEDKNKFLIQVVSYSSKESAKCGSKLVTIIDCNLHTLEENRTEHITKKDITKERRNYMTICESGYYNKVTRICGERNFVKRIYHSFEDAHNFLLEGANVVLLRYFGITRYRGHVKTDTVLIDGMICQSIYVCLGVSQAIVNGKPLFIVKVERHIIEPSGFIHQTLTVLTLRGYIVSHEWADNSYIFHVNPLLRVIPEKDEIESHEPLRENWRADLQLLSDYLDFKSARSSEGARYVSENGELTGIIRDYLQTLLLLRPHDVMHFTRHYFGSALSELDLPHSEFFEPCRKNVRYCYFED